MAFHPYLFFGGTCRDAFTRYHEIFGGDLTLLPMSETPDAEVPPEQADLIMHASLILGDGLLMGSDDPTSDTVGPVQGMQVSYSVADAAEAERVFEQLADGGQVTMPIEQTFWSPAFGMCIDRFGTPWMVGADSPET
jgi:PhnB protein